MPEMHSGPLRPEPESAPYLKLFGAKQQERAKDLFADDFSQALCELAEELNRLDLEPSILSDFLLQRRDLLRSSGSIEFCRELGSLIGLATATDGISAPRLIQILTRCGTVWSREELFAVHSIVERGIYPGPLMIEQLLALDRSKRAEWLESLCETMSAIREHEEFVEGDQIALELYYTHLDVDMPFDRFVEVMNLVPAHMIAPVPAHFQPFRISAHGVLALTDATDPEFVASVRSHLSDSAEQQSVLDNLAHTPHLSGKVLLPEYKMRLMLGSALLVAQRLQDKDPMLHYAHEDRNPFTTANILGSLPAVLAAEPSYHKCMLLRHARATLRSFVAETTEQLKGESFNRKQREIILPNLEQAHLLSQYSIKMLADEAPHVASSVAVDRQGQHEFIGLLELLLEIDESRDRGPDEEDLYRQLGQALYRVSFEQFSRLSSETLRELLLEKALSLQCASVVGCVGAAQELWCTLELLALQDVPAIAQEAQSDKADLVLENAHELYAERVPQALLHVARDEMRHVVLARSAQRALRDIVKHEADKLIDAIEKAVCGANEFLGRREQTSELHTQFTKFAQSVKKRIAETRHNLKEPPGQIERYYVPECIKHIAQTCKYHVGANRTLARMLGAAPPSTAEQRMLSSLKLRLGQLGQALEALHACIVTAEELVATADSWEEGLPGLIRMLGKVTERISSEVLGPISAQQESDSSRACQVVKRFVSEAHQLAGRLDPVSSLKLAKLAPVRVELAKITYQDLEEGEFEVVPSKKKGDAVKAWISNDCGTGDAECRQVLNKAFVNDRVIRDQDRQEVWCGNSCVLEAKWGEVPVLLIDVAHTSRQTAVNHRMFLRGLVQGLAARAERVDQALIISNEIDSIEEYYLFSNRPGMRAAYMKDYADARVIESTKQQPVTIEDNLSADSFQSLAYGNGRYVVLWENPNIAAVVDVDEVDQLVRPLVGDKLTDKLRKRAETDELLFQMRFLSERGIERLRGLASVPLQLSMFLTLSERYFHKPSAWLTLHDPEKLEVLVQFHACNGELAQQALFALAESKPEVLPRFKEILELLRGHSEYGRYVGELFDHHLILSPQEIEDSQSHFERLCDVGLGQIFVQTYSSDRGFSEDLMAISALVADQLLTTSDSELAVAVYKNMYRLVGLDVRTVVTHLKTLERLRAQCTSVEQSLTRTQLISALSHRRLSLDEVGQLVDTLSRYERDQRYLSINLEFAAVALDHGLLPRYPADRLLALLCSVQQQIPGGGFKEYDCSTALAPLRTADFIRCLMRSGQQLGDFESIVQQIRVSDEPQEKSARVRILLLDKDRVLPAVLMSRAPDHEMQEWHFYLSHVDQHTLDGSDNLPALRTKFLEQHYEGMGLSALPKVTELIRSGLDYLFVRPEYAKLLGNFLALEKLARYERCCGGGLGDVSEDEIDDQEFEVGYESLDDFFSDQRTVYSEPFHS